MVDQSQQRLLRFDLYQKYNLMVSLDHEELMLIGAILTFEILLDSIALTLLLYLPQLKIQNKPILLWNIFVLLFLLNFLFLLLWKFSWSYILANFYFSFLFIKYFFTHYSLSSKLKLNDWKLILEVSLLLFLHLQHFHRHLIFQLSFFTSWLHLNCQN